MTSVDTPIILCGGFETYIQKLFGDPSQLAGYVASGKSFAEFVGDANPGFASHLGDLERWIAVLPQELQDTIMAVIEDLATRQSHCFFSWTRDQETRVVFEMNQMGFLSMNIHSPSCEDYAAMTEAKSHPVPAPDTP